MMDLLSNIAMLFGGAGDVGQTPVEQGVGYSPEIPMSTGVDTGFNTPAQPTDASAGVSPSLWQQILNFAGMNSEGSPDTSGHEIDPKTGKSSKSKQDDLAAFGKFLTAAQGMQSSLQNSRMGQQMIQQHINQPQQQGQYRPPQDMATLILRNAGLL